MAGSSSFTSVPLPLDLAAPIVLVFRYDPTQVGDTKYVYLPNVRWLSDETAEGAHPGVATFRYVFGDPLTDGLNPERTEQVFPITSFGPRVVNTDDRLVVRKYFSDGSYQYLFDGFVQSPDAAVDGDSEQVSFIAKGVAIREFDIALAGALMRSAFAPQSTDRKSHFQTGLDARFNPDGKPNATPLLYDINQGNPNAYPAFLDVNANGDGDPANDERALWTLDRAARYIIFTGNADEEFIKNPRASTISNLLLAVEPVGDFIDWDDDSTFTEDVIVVPDYSITGKPWPVALEELITPHGFGMRFGLTQDKNGDPVTSLVLYRRDNSSRAKTLNLQAVGAVLDPGLTNIGMQVARDTSNLVNQIVIDTELMRIEASFVLAPLFPIAVADGNDDATTRNKWTEGEATFDPVKYRLFGLDETGDGHWDFNANAMASPALSAIRWTSLFKPYVQTDANGLNMITRRRRGFSPLFSLDALGRPLEKQLWIAALPGPQNPPNIWDGAAGVTWQQVHSSEWSLLEDRLGIRLTPHKVWDWNIGPAVSNTAMPFPSGRVNVPKSLASLDVTHPRFVFRLTCVVELDSTLTDDRLLPVTARKRVCSPTEFPVERREDTRDRFVRHVISQYSHLNTTNADIIARDDLEDAQAHADARRRAHELGSLAGSATIPRLISGYHPGDVVWLVRGRGINLRTNVAIEQGESSVFPVITSRTRTMGESHITTVLNLSDRRADPPPWRSRRPNWLGRRR